MKPIGYRTIISLLIKDLVILNEMRLRKAYGILYEPPKTRAWLQPGSTSTPAAKEDR